MAAGTDSFTSQCKNLFTNAYKKLPLNREFNLLKKKGGPICTLEYLMQYIFFKFFFFIKIRPSCQLGQVFHKLLFRGVGNSMNRKLNTNWILSNNQDSEPDIPNYYFISSILAWTIVVFCHRFEINEKGILKKWYTFDKPKTCELIKYKNRK